MGLKGGISNDAYFEPLKYFDTVIVEVKTFFTLFRLALAILCLILSLIEAELFLGKNNIITIDRYLLLSAVFEEGSYFNIFRFFLCLHDWKIYSHRL